jgi:hypothetical protein
MVFQTNALDIFQEDHWYIWHIYLLITVLGCPIFQSLGRKQSFNVTETRQGTNIYSKFTTDKPLVCNRQAIRKSYSENWKISKTHTSPRLAHSLQHSICIRLYKKKFAGDKQKSFNENEHVCDIV